MSNLAERFNTQVYVGTYAKYNNGSIFGAEAWRKVHLGSFLGYDRNIKGAIS